MAKKRPNLDQNWHFWPNIGIFGRLSLMPNQKTKQKSLVFLLRGYQNFCFLPYELGFLAKNGKFWSTICIFGHFGPNIVIFGTFCPMLDRKGFAFSDSALWSWIGQKDINFKSLNKTQHQEYGSPAAGHNVIFCRRDELVYTSQLNTHCRGKNC